MNSYTLTYSESFRFSIELHVSYWRTVLWFQRIQDFGRDSSGGHADLFVRDCIVTNYGGGGGGGGVQKGRGGGHVKFYPYEKGGGAEQVLAMLKGGHKKFWGSFIYVVA